MPGRDKSIDLNADVGEIPGLKATEEQLLPLVSSVNIACGGHAGDSESMTRLVRLARVLGAGIGAHPGYPDRKNFGRMEMNIPPTRLHKSLKDQIQALMRIAGDHGTGVSHVKPHGALYGLASRDRYTARLIGMVCGELDKDLILVGMAGSVMLEVWEAMGLAVSGEAFADRRYEADGTLRSRVHPDALIHNPAAAAGQARGIVDHKVRAADGTEIVVEARTICIHSDTPGCVEIARSVRTGLEELGVLIEPLTLITGPCLTMLLSTF